MSQLHLTRPVPVRPRCSNDPAVVAAPPMVFVVDEDIAVRNLLELLANRAGWHVETFAWARDFLSRPRAFEPSCFVLDAQLSDVDGLDVQQRLADRPELPIIFLSGGSDVRIAVLAMKAGALEFLTKPLSGEFLLRSYP